MLLAFRRSAPLALMCAVLGAIVWLGQGCNGTDETTESTAASTTASSTATTAPSTSDTTTDGTTPTTASTPRTSIGGGVDRVVVGGKTVEEYEAALPDLEKAAADNPTDLAALQELAIAQYVTNRLDEAAATYVKMLALKEDAFTRNNYANVLRDAGKTDQAKNEYEKAIATDATLAVAYINLASVLAKEGKISEAEKVIDRGIAATSGEDKADLQSYKETLQALTTTTT